jgi:5-formyltetrahydrofolate cyclo-ligase
MNKSTLRRQLRAARSAIGAPARRQASRDAARIASRLGLLLRARRIGFYLPHNAEFDITPLLNQALCMKRACYLPVIPRRQARAMRFALIHDRHEMEANRYGIHEPQDPRPLLARQLDLLLVPLVGFDDRGYRLGMGGGYYDATLAYLSRRRHWKKPLLIGVGYECQRVDRLPHDPWDRPLDAVLTERRLYRFRPGAQ